MSPSPGTRDIGQLKHVVERDIATLLPGTSSSPAVIRSKLRTVRRVGILGTGSYLPDRVMKNEELERLVETTDDWIVARTGMRERRIAAPGQATSDLAAQAAQRALEQAHLAPQDVELILIGTVTPDHVVCPPTACNVQHKIGATRAAGFDVVAACPSFLNALMTGHNLIATGAFGNALIVGADVLSSVVDYRDRDTCILFGDGAGAVVLVPDPDGGELLDHVVGIDGSGSDLITVPAGGTSKPTSPETVAAGEHHIRIQGRKVYKFAVVKTCELIELTVKRNGLNISDIDLFIPHQANLRIIEEACRKLGIDMDRVLVNIDRYGNTSSASVPIALDEAARTGRLQPDQLVCLAAFGGGLTWASTLIRW